MWYVSKEYKWTRRQNWRKYPGYNKERQNGRKYRGEGERPRRHRNVWT